MPSEREIFNRLFPSRGPIDPIEFLRETAVLGLVNYYKWDRAHTWEDDHGGETIAAEELAKINFTDQEMYDYEATVRATLQGYVEGVRPTRGFFYGVWQSVLGSFVYSVGVSVLLVTGYVALKARDIDLIEIFLGFMGQSQ